MAAYYIDSNASGANDGTSWTDAYDTVNTAISGKSAGDIFYVASNHAESTASTVQWNMPGSAALNPVIFISASTAASPPTTYTRGASCTVTGGANDLWIQATTASHTVFIGMDFNAQDYLYATNVAGGVSYFFDCGFSINNNSSADRLYLAGSACYGYFENCTFDFENAGQEFWLTSYSRVDMVDCSLAGTSAALSGYVFDCSGGASTLDVRGLDLSNAAATVDLFKPPSAQGSGTFRARASGVKLPSSWTGTIMNAAHVPPEGRCEVYVADDADTIYQIYVDAGVGTVRSETTTVHTGTYDGTNKYSLKVDNDAAAEECAQPMRVQVAEFWAAANPTLTVKVTSDSTLTDQDFWIEVESPDSTTGSLSNFGRTRNANYFLGTGTTLTSGSGWTSAKTNQYQVSHTVTSSQAGVHRVYAYLASDAAITVYIDPDVTIA